VENDIEGRVGGADGGLDLSRRNIEQRTIEPCAFLIDGELVIR